jgi:Probable cobalt transporter subunit (CbtA)
METRIIARGLLAGALGGVLAFVFARIFVEPVIGRAIDYEDGRSEAQAAMGAHEHGMEVFTRDVQANVGMGFGVLAFSLAMGALFAVAFVVAHGRVGTVGPGVLSLLMAAGAFGAIYLVPFLKYPANPPSVGNPETIGERTVLYLLMMLLSLVLAMAALWLGRRLAPRLGAFGATLSAAGAYIVAITIVMLALPPVAETPGPLRDRSGTIVYPGFPADDLYHFRLYSVGAQLVLWATIGVVFATLISRLFGEHSRTEQEQSVAG